MGMSTIRIKQLRIDKGLTLGQLAEKVGLSESHLSRVEAGARGVDDSGVIAPAIPEISRPLIPGLSRPPVPELCRPSIPELIRPPVEAA